MQLPQTGSSICRAPRYKSPCDLLNKTKRSWETGTLWIVGTGYGKAPALPHSLPSYRWFCPAAFPGLAAELCNCISVHQAPFPLVSEVPQSSDVPAPLFTEYPTPSLQNSTSDRNAFPGRVAASQTLCQERPHGHPKAVFQAPNEKTPQLTRGKKPQRKPTHTLTGETKGVGNETEGGQSV